MPGWGWAILAVIMVAGVAAGLVYAFKRFRAAMHMVSALGNAVGTRLDRMANATAPQSPAPSVAFTQPLDTSVERYAQAHENVIRRKSARRMRHMEAWARWDTFGEK